MTKEEILAEIAAKIDGQGSAIDAGSALPGILRGILDLIPSPTPSGPTVRVIDVTVRSETNVFFSDGLNDAQIMEWAAAGDITIIHWTDDGEDYYSVVNTAGPGGRCYAYEPKGNRWIHLD